MDTESHTLTWKRHEKWDLTTNQVATLLMVLSVPAYCRVTPVTGSQAT